MKNITEYEKLGEANIFPTQYGCKNCGYMGKLHRHGFYSRNVITRYTAYRIFILRVKCPSCNKTYSLLPSFLIPYYQYSFDFIFLCLCYIYIKKHSYLKIVSIFKQLNPKSTFSISNISFYKKRMNSVNSITNSFFANFSAFYYDMNNPSVESVVKKIKLFIEKESDFNYSYFNNMPRYFFAKI